MGILGPWGITETIETNGKPLKVIQNFRKLCEIIESCGKPWKIM